MTAEIGPRRKAPPQNKPEGFVAPYDAFEPRFKSADDLLLVIFGIECHNPEHAPDDLRQRLTMAFQASLGPNVLESGTVRHGFGPNAELWFAYWKNHADYDQWCEKAGVNDLFDDPRILDSDFGLWREYCRISLDHNETSASREQNVSGIANLSDAVEITPVHGYWGSLRDRLVAAVDDKLPAHCATRGNAESNTFGKRILVEAPENVCLIRTTQDLADANDSQRAKYLSDVRPALEDGLSFIRSNYASTGCIGMRFIDELEDNSTRSQRTVGLGFWCSLSHLEAWTHSHATHQRIMAEFMTMVEQFKGEPGLSLWHEVSVFPAGWLRGDYVNCSPDGSLMQLGKLT